MTTDRRWPWGSIFMLIVLAGTVLTTGSGRPPLTQAAAVLLLAATFLIGRLTLSWFWGVVAALLAAGHPQVREALDQAASWAALAGPFFWLTVAGVLLAVQAAFQANARWLEWLVALIVLVVALAFAWSCQPVIGLMASLLTFLALTAAAGLAWQLRRRGRDPAPGRVNLALAAAAGVLVPLAGFGLAPLAHQFLSSAPNQAELLAALRGLWPPRFQALSWNGLQQSLWPSAWLVGPLLIWALWRTLRRGWRQWRQGRPPLAWVLTLAAAALALLWLLTPPADTPVAGPWTAGSVVFLVFWLGDLVRGAWERLVLQPEG